MYLDYTLMILVLQSPPRQQFQGRPRPRRCAVDTLASLLPPPRSDRLLRQGQVARWRPTHRGGAGHLGRGSTQERAPGLVVRTGRETGTDPTSGLFTRVSRSVFS